MKLPAIVAELVKAQNNLDSIAYSDCFSEKAVVFDEGETYNGRKEIRQWIKTANEKYKPAMKPVAFVGEKSKYVLTAEVSGTFDGSPAILKYHFDIVDGQIQSLKITG